MSIEYLIGYCKGIPDDFVIEGEPTLADFVEDAEQELINLANPIESQVGKAAPSSDVLLAKGGIIEYKCRRCGAIDKSLHAPNIETAVICLALDMDMPKAWHGVGAEMKGVHHCKDGGTGITDCIGGVGDSK